MNFHPSFDDDGKSGPPRIPAPEDFAERAQKSSNRELKRHYSVGDKTLARWRKESECPATSGRIVSLTNAKMPVPSDFKDFAPRETNRVLAERFHVGDKTITRWRKETGCTAPITAMRGGVQLPKQFVPPIPAGTASEACHWLRKDFRPVYDRGIVDGKEFKGQYVVGRQVLSEQGVIDFARSRGFKTAAEELAAFDKYD